jgi:CheY-like chemotaxis protein
LASPKPPLRVLIVEDEVILAMDIEIIVEDTGHQVVAEAASLHDVVGLPASLDPDLALVDIHLAQETNGLDVSAFIQTRWAKTIIVFITANPKKVPDDYGGAHGVIAKPFSHAGLLSAMRYLTEGVCEPPPTSPLPANFKIAPAFAASWSPN